MEVFETQTFFPATAGEIYGHWYKDAKLTAQANGGAVLLEIQFGDGDEWITLENFTENIVKNVDIRLSRVRVTPTSGAKFTWVVG